MKVWRWGALVSVSLLSLGSIAAQGGVLGDKRKLAADTAQRQVTEFLEITNIKLRRFLFGKPGVITYTTFLAEGGRPILYIPVKGKCSSSAKKLLPGEKGVLLEDGPDGKHIKYRTEVMPEQSEDGTFGTSAPYIYCFTPNGTYFQWNGKYAESSRPMELTIKPVVLTGEIKETLR